MPTQTQSISGGCQITVTRFGGLHLLSAGDVIYPPVDDPYAVGKAACAHCLSALYACGVSEVCQVVKLCFGHINQISQFCFYQIPLFNFPGFGFQINRMEIEEPVSPHTNAICENMS